MTVHVRHFLYCSKCSREFNESCDSPEEVRELAVSSGWLRVKVQNGSRWDYCTREACQQEAQEQRKLVKQTPETPEVPCTVVALRTARLSSPTLIGNFKDENEAKAALPPHLQFTRTLSGTQKQIAYGKPFKLTDGRQEMYTYILETLPVQSS